MPVLGINWEDKSHEVGSLYEIGATKGAKSEQWSLVTDGRISSPATGKIGPVVYKGLPNEDVDGNALPPDDALFMFWDETDVVIGTLVDVAATDLDLTIADFLETSGASITVMKTKRPSID
ncbi:hypothetical protein QUF75_02060 [Desulfococcaceae bacterium HSG7]|nr:hypothetical protein [Desulfococcaceae bacterium HSG7]